MNEFLSIICNLNTNISFLQSMVSGFPGRHGASVTSHAEVEFSSGTGLVTALIMMGLIASERTYRIRHATISIVQVSVFSFCLYIKIITGQLIYGHI